MSTKHYTAEQAARFVEAKIETYLEHLDDLTSMMDALSTAFDVGSQEFTKQAAFIGALDEHRYKTGFFQDELQLTLGAYDRRHEANAVVA
jgi:transcriptional accessory protein Tex/SPT6